MSEQQPDFNNFLANMANSNEFSSLMSGLTNSLQQASNEEQPNNNETKKKNNNNEDEEEENDNDEDDDFDDLLYNLLTNQKEEPFPDILSRIEDKLDNVGKCFERQNTILEKICENLSNK